MLKLIRCAVRADAVDDFAAGQTRWHELATIDGFVAQLGGWARHAERVAVVVAMWRDRAGYDAFMRLHHDRIADASRQRDTYRHLTVELAEAVLPVDLAGLTATLTVERDAAGAVRAVVSGEPAGTGSRDVVDIEPAWTVIGAPPRREQAMSEANHPGDDFGAHAGSAHP